MDLFKKAIASPYFRNLLFDMKSHGLFGLEEDEGDFLMPIREPEKPLIIYGASDDLMEFRGALDEEAGAYDANRRIVCSDGTHLRFWWDDHYGFKITILQTGNSAVQLDQPEESLYDDGEDYNGHRATITPAPQWVMVGRYEPIDGDAPEA